MSMNLTSADKELNDLLQGIERDGSVSSLEFQKLRDCADAEAEKVTPDISDALNAFQKTADQTVEALQKLGLQARKLKLGVPDKDAQQNAIKNATKAALKKSIEFQLAYVVSGYKSTIEAL